MTDRRDDSFGLLIACVVPGGLAVQQLATFAMPLREWLSTAPDHAPTVAGFVFTVASVGAGLTASTLRWLVLDTVHHRTGNRPIPEQRSTRYRCTPILRINSNGDSFAAKQKEKSAT